jgi:hypothetical protein
MSRKKLLRQLSALPKVPAFKAKDHKFARLLELLRGVAINNQREEAHVFYPVREVAKHFHVPISMVGRLYEQLEEEGILAVVRGSKTLLQGLSSGRHFSVLGFIGMPAAVSAFVTLQDYRMFFIRTRRELRARGFAVAMVLFEPGQLKSGHLAARIGKHEFDTVLWYRPDSPVRDIITYLKDAGVRVIGVNDGGVTTIRCRYEVRRESAIKAILGDWHKGGRAKSVVIVRGGGASVAKEEMLQALLEEQHLSYDFQEVRSARPDVFLESLGRGKDDAVIFPSRAASIFAFRAPEALMDLMARCRVAFTGGPPSIAFTKIREVPGDFVVVDWQLMAEQIVSDLISKSALDRAELTVFEAKAHTQVALSHYAQSL